jgi:hypothetical protein
MRTWFGPRAVGHEHRSSRCDLISRLADSAEVRELGSVSVSWLQDNPMIKRYYLGA